ncbi:ThuA domain-containing protein, partial [Singulisphaera rosea]
MPRAIRLLFLLPGLAVVPVTRVSADEPVKPIRALLITGGCCHDYTKQKTILSEGISARAPVVWTIVQQGGTTTNTKLPVYENPDWAKGYDIVVHNECFSDIPDPAWTQRILKPHKEGTPAVVIHCAMHGYRDKTDEWFKFLGVTSHRHGATYPFKVVNLAKDNPIMAGFGDSWQTANGELYLISKVWDTATPLAHARSRDTNKDEVCIWTNAYGNNTRVFGTTVGHHNEEMSDPVFLNYITRGLLWAVGKLDAQHLKAAEAKPAGLVPENLALGK